MFDALCSLAQIAPRNMSRILFDLAGAVYDRAAPLARRWLPAPIKRRLFGLVGGIEARLDQGRSRAPAPALSDAAPLLAPDAFTGSIVLVNNALAWGGAERQLVNTILGLEARLGEPVTLLCQKLGEHVDYDFYKPALARMRGDARNMSALTEARAGMSNEDASRISAQIAWLPVDVRERVVQLACDFITVRPRVVHAWQDALSIEAGYAAALVGVTRIVLSGRNLAPTHFAYHRPYMRDAYTRLAAHPNVRMLNNSEAGARDYATWLGLPAEHIRVLRNGFDFSALGDPQPICARYGIPSQAPIIGSVFRFYEEKRPLLWIEAAAQIAAARPDAHFIVFGVGPLLTEARALAALRGFGARLHTPGAQPDAATQAAAFDVFMLTSKHEGTPNVVLEASAHGVPVVLTDAGGASEAVMEGMTGYVTDDQPAALAARVLTILDDDQFRTRCAEDGPAFVRARFGLERMIDETLDAYR